MLSYRSDIFVFDSGPQQVTGKRSSRAADSIEPRMADQQPRRGYINHHRLQGRQSSPALQQAQTSASVLPDLYINPLPQTQWTDVQTSYHQHPAEARRQQDDRQDRRRSYNPTSSRLHQPTLTTRSAQSSSEGNNTKERRQARGFRQLLSRERDDRSPQQSNMASLYPQLSPYNSNERLSTHSAHSAPDDLEYYQARALHQPYAPTYLTPPSSHDRRPVTSAPRSPTYPPAGRRRMHSSSGAGDAAFADAEEFHLFVEATAGLGPMQFTRDPDSPTITSPRRTQSERVPQLHLHGPGEGDVISPLSDTPTTRYALQQLAQLPEGSPRHEPQRQSYFEHDSWLQPTSGRRTPEELDISPLEGLEELDLEDELPDYAESQAQAQSHQRAEASRRAQELQRRWQLSGARRGI